MHDQWKPNVYALNGYVAGNFPTRHRGLKLPRVLANMLRGHAAAYRAIHEIQREAGGLRSPSPPDGRQTVWSPLDALMRNLRYGTVNMTFPSGSARGS